MTYTRFVAERMLLVDVATLPEIHQDYYVMMDRLRIILEYTYNTHTYNSKIIKVPSKSGFTPGHIKLKESIIDDDCRIEYGTTHTSKYFKLDLFGDTLIPCKMKFGGRIETIASRDVVFKIVYMLFTNPLKDRSSEICHGELMSLVREFHEDYMGEDLYGQTIVNTILKDSLTSKELSRLEAWT